MNLIKSFNFKYLKENIKKSKGLIILLLIVVPLLTTLFTVLFVNGEDAVNLANETNINWGNMLGMYIVPIGISFALFGYIYRKNSVDLINSMPLNKQTIFITNTIGGIILITLMQIITTILLFICGLICSNLVIFWKMLIDLFITMWVAYVFIFAATNLAMAISGTFITQLVLTALILFLVPFTILIFRADIGEEYRIILSNGSDIYAYHNTSYTLPIQIPICFFMSESLYNFNSILKTILLGIIYLVLGTILFKIRKMENTEESFKNEKIHLLVKALTVFPMVVFFNKMELSRVLMIFIIAIISIYYFAYDFIVKRKVKLIVSIIALVLTLGFSYLVDITIDEIEENLLAEVRKVKIENIQEVAINLKGAYMWRYGYKIDSYFIDNDQILNFVKELEERTIELANNTIETNDIEALPNNNISVTYKTKSGKIVKSGLSMYDEEVSELIELLSKDEKYVNCVKEEYIADGKICIDGKVVSEEFEKEIIPKIKDEINNMTLSEIYDKLINNDEIKFYSSFSNVHYSNHNYITSNLKFGFSKEVANMIVEYQNKMASESIKKVNTRVIDVRCITDSYNNINYDLNYFYNTREEIVKFIKDNENVKCDITQEFYQLNFYDWKAKISGIFYTNKIDEVSEILKKEQESRDEMVEDVVVYDGKNTMIYSDENIIVQEPEIIY